jgi:hypothetical protein
MGVVWGYGEVVGMGNWGYDLIVNCQLLIVNCK